MDWCLKFATVEEQKDLTIEDLFKIKVLLEVKEYFIDEWSTITSSAVFVQLLDKQGKIWRFKNKSTRKDDNAAKKGFSGIINLCTESQAASPKSQFYFH